ncbi:hypothetical protein PC116_g9609 [Phytophthora cactorum]|uniref:Structure-specific endonuclease subunit SLX1 homolog n=1 Tax=Phytophthora cactorum TaxID=29920 RepID=A0A8T1L1C9_9STRA|nr:hypothetical protein PC112_g17738 [Phytophthora cactorum]KAG2810892.1 hypothetical protein PC111_g15456 [Phytophthora cactorum]KAG2847641.1 hypothetical protein PC113_g17735 [Phytophthora cactorum]KAG2897440.1 hypothetical protein PC115_g17183 [Phytophthora cactorum]KAG2969427.1 hypothetical protein PC118_g17451 [Phytophthora cactorum]
MPFFACYLLTPVQPPQRLRCSYIGYTVVPTRRIRQHNGELANGAKRTRKFRPWEMIAVVHGFPSKFRALQFEWVWQHPQVSKISKTHLEFLRGSRGLGAPRSVKRKLVEMLEMVNLEPFKGLNLTVSFTSDEIHNTARGLGARYAAAHCETRALETFLGVDKGTTGSKCFIYCEMCCHAPCLVGHFRSMREEDDEVDSGECPECQQVLDWSLLTQHLGQEKGKRKRTGGKRREQSNKKARVSKPKSTAEINADQRREVDAISIGSSVSSSDLVAEYNSDGWFADHGECESDGEDLDAEAPPNILDIQPSNHEAEMIDLT